MTRVEIDLNVRVRGNGSYAGFENVTGPLLVGEEVEVYESESGLTGKGRITEIDTERELVYLSVDWASLQAAPEPLADVGADFMVSRGRVDMVSHVLRLFGQKLLPSASYNAVVIPFLYNAANTGPLVMTYNAANTGPLVMTTGMNTIKLHGPMPIQRPILAEIAWPTARLWLEFTQSGAVQGNPLAVAS